MALGGWRGWQAITHTNSRMYWWEDQDHWAKDGSNNIKAWERYVCKRCNDQNPDELARCDTHAWFARFHCGAGPSVFIPKGYMPNLDDWSGCYDKGTVGAAMALVEWTTDQYPNQSNKKGFTAIVRNTFPGLHACQPTIINIYNTCTLAMIQLLSQHPAGSLIYACVTFLASRDHPVLLSKRYLIKHGIDAPMGIRFD